MRREVTRWKVITRGLVAVTVIATIAACSGGDDDGASADTIETGTTDAATGGDADAPEATDGGTETETETTDDVGGGPIVVESLDDIPEVCRDIVADFLRQIEPIVEPVDWSTASFNDFTTIADEFEELASEFDAATAAAPQCDELELADDDDFALLVEFGEDVAPGTVPFLQFLSDLSDAAATDLDGGSADPFEDCAGARVYVEDLMASYSSLQEVPVAQMTALMSLGTALVDCGPEDQAFFESEAVQDFIAG